MPLALHSLALLAALFPSIPGITPEYQKPDESLSGGYFAILEQQGHVIYPALGLLVLVLLAFGIIQAWRSEQLDGLQKTEFKREIVLILRRQLGGETVDVIARRIGLEPLRTVRLLEEMQADGILASHTSTDRKTMWRVKGTGLTQHGR